MRESQDRKASTDDVSGVIPQNNTPKRYIFQREPQRRPLDDFQGKRERGIGTHTQKPASRCATWNKQHDTEHQIYGELLKPTCDFD